jgi:four helix bundle protein
MDKPHKNLKAWQLAMDIVLDVYKLTESFPSEEKYGLTSQRCRTEYREGVRQFSSHSTRVTSRA